MTPVQGSYYLTLEEYDKYVKASQKAKKALAEREYWESLARMRQANGNRQR